MCIRDRQHACSLFFFVSSLFSSPAFVSSSLSSAICVWPAWWAAPLIVYFLSPTHPGMLILVHCVIFRRCPHASRVGNQGPRPDRPLPHAHQRATRCHQEEVGGEGVCEALNSYKSCSQIGRRWFGGNSYPRFRKYLEKNSWLWKNGWKIDLSS